METQRRNTVEAQTGCVTGLAKWWFEEPQGHESGAAGDMNGGLGEVHTGSSSSTSIASEVGNLHELADDIGSEARHQN